MHRKAILAIDASVTFWQLLIDRTSRFGHLKMQIHDQHGNIKFILIIMNNNKALVPKEWDWLWIINRLITILNQKQSNQKISWIAYLVLNLQSLFQNYPYTLECFALVPYNLSMLLKKNPLSSDGKNWCDKQNSCHFIGSIIIIVTSVSWIPFSTSTFSIHHMKVGPFWSIF